jgi:Uma2 family endonuclease
MNQVHKIVWISEEEYLEGEPFAKTRHEYIDGQVYAMAGANARHNLISGNVYYHLKTATRGTHCQVFMNDMKFRFSEKKSFIIQMLCYAVIWKIITIYIVRNHV